ncbi:sulfurtransferase TusA family protein [Colwellia psychrerythraea]|uniref:SirA-like domain-containing protein n=1 Tax=Colwellia psychrerythraea TaxID=28229 RepID=A0A099KAP9_COLPS|nr:sulfurtransferase TusA family protein [Colwellia psychrerythraea]KGJ87385.1 SirA-like domain-containing protein [Colwellia psychrerythraea]
MIYKYDGRGEKCPVPLVNLRLLLKKMHPNDECIITIDDLGSITDIPKLLTKQGYHYREQNTVNGIVEISIKVT